MDDATLALPAPTCPLVSDAEMTRVLADTAAVAGVAGVSIELECEQTGDRRCYAWGDLTSAQDTLELGTSAGFRLRLRCQGATELSGPLCSVLRELTLRMVAAHALAHENRLLQRLVDGADDPLLLFGADGTILQANRAADLLLARQTEQALAVVSPEGAEPLLAAICSAAQASARSLEPHSLTLSLGDGSLVTCELRPVATPWPLTVAVQLRLAPPARCDAVQRFSEGCGLSPREVEVLELLLAGSATADVAVALGISAHTVRDHLKHLYRKTGTASRGELLALLSRLVAPPSAGA